VVVTHNKPPTFVEAPQYAVGTVVVAFGIIMPCTVVVAIPLTLNVPETVVLVDEIVTVPVVEPMLANLTAPVEEAVAKAISRTEVRFLLLKLMLAAVELILAS